MMLSYAVRVLWLSSMLLLFLRLHVCNCNGDHGILMSQLPLHP